MCTGSASIILPCVIGLHHIEKQEQLYQKRFFPCLSLFTHYWHSIYTVSPRKHFTKTIPESGLGKGGLAGRGITLFSDIQAYFMYNNDKQAIKNSKNNISTSDEYLFRFDRTIWHFHISTKKLLLAPCFQEFLLTYSGIFSRTLIQTTKSVKGPLTGIVYIRLG